MASPRQKGKRQSQRYGGSGEICSSADVLGELRYMFLAAMREHASEVRESLYQKVFQPLYQGADPPTETQLQQALTKWSATAFYGNLDTEWIQEAAKVAVEDWRTEGYDGQWMLVEPLDAPSVFDSHAADLRNPERIVAMEFLRQDQDPTTPDLHQRRGDPDKFLCGPPFDFHAPHWDPSKDSWPKYKTDTLRVCEEELERYRKPIWETWEQLREAAPEMELTKPRPRPMKWEEEHFRLVVLYQIKNYTWGTLGDYHIAAKRTIRTDVEALTQELGLPVRRGPLVSTKKTGRPKGPWVKKKDHTEK